MSRLNAAGSSVTDIVGVQQECSLDGESRVWFFPELGSETFRAGEMVCLSGSAANAVGLTKPGTDASGYGIVGFAADNASGYTSAFKGVMIATPDNIFVGNVNNVTTSASAQTAATDLGQLYGLTSLSGTTYVDKTKTQTSTISCRVIGFYGGDTVPSFYGRVYFQVLQSKCQLTNNIWLNTSSPVTLQV